jgi:hypothetical protein
MADESKLNIEITADASGVELGTSAAAASISELERAVKTATANMAEAESWFGKAAAAGNQQAADALAIYVAELAAAKTVLAERSEVVAASAAALSSEASATNASSTALNVNSAATDAIAAAKLRAATAWNREMAAANKAEETLAASTRAAEMAALKDDILTRSQMELTGAEDTGTAARLAASTAWNREMAAANAAEVAVAEAARVEELAALKADILARSEIGLAGAEEKVAVASFNHAEAMGAARISMGAMSGSMGMMEGGMARVIGASAVMGPALAAAVPVAIFAVGVGMAIQLGEAIYKAFDMGGQAARKSQEEIRGVTDTLDRMGASLNVELDKEIEAKAKSDGKPFDGLKLSADEAAVAAANLEEKLDGVIKREEVMLAGMAGTTTQQIFGIKGGTGYEQSMVGEHARHLDEAPDTTAALKESESYGRSLMERKNQLQAIANLGKGATLAGTGGSQSIMYEGYDREGKAIQKTMDLGDAKRLSSTANIQTEYDATVRLIALQEKEHGVIATTIAVETNMPKKETGAKLGEEKDKGELEAWKKAQDEKFKLEADHIKANHVLELISLKEETEQLEALGVRRRAMQEDYYDRAIKIAGMTPSSRNQIPTLRAEKGNLPSEGEAENLGLNTSLAAQRLNQEKQIDSQAITAKQSKSLAIIAGEREQAKTLESLHQTSAEATAVLDRALVAREFQAELDANAAKHAIAVADGDKGVVLAAQLASERETIKVNLDNKLQAIDDATAVKRFDKERSAKMKEMEGATTTENKGYQTKVQGEDKKEAIGGEGFGAWAQNSKSALDQWHAEQQAAYAAMITYTATVYGKDTSQYQEAIKKKEELDLDYERKNQQMQERIAQHYAAMAVQVNNSLTGVMNRWMTSSGSMEIAWRNAANHMAVSMIDSLGKQLLKHQEYEMAIRARHLLTVEANKALDAQGFAVEDASLMARLARWIAVELGILQAHTGTTIAKLGADTSAAGVAAGLAVTQGMVNVGLAVSNSAVAATGAAAAAGPLAPAVAPAVMADMIPYIAMATFSFAKGGVVSGSVGYGQELPILATPGERVLSTSQTKKFDGLLSGNSPQQGGSNHFHYSPSISGIDGASVAGMAQAHSATFFREASKAARRMNS